MYLLIMSTRVKSTKPSAGFLSVHPKRVHPTRELQLAELVVHKCRVPRAGPRLLPFVLPSDLVDKPAQRSWAMQAVANHVPGE